MIFKYKKGNVTNSVVLWIFFVFFYFTIGYSIVKEIIESLNVFTGAMGFLAGIVPFIPIIGLMWWGYTIITPETSTNLGGEQQ
jgi:hypothetical protein